MPPRQRKALKVEAVAAVVLEAQQAVKADPAGDIPNDVGVVKLEASATSAEAAVPLISDSQLSDAEQWLANKNAKAEVKRRNAAAKKAAAAEAKAAAAAIEAQAASAAVPATQDVPNTPKAKAPVRRRKKAATAEEASNGAVPAEQALPAIPAAAATAAPDPAPVASKPARGRKGAAAGDKPPAPRKRASKAAAAKAGEADLSASDIKIELDTSTSTLSAPTDAVAAAVEVATKPKPKPRSRKKKADAAADGGDQAVAAGAGTAEGGEDGGEEKPAPRKRARRAKPTGPVFEIPGPEILETTQKVVLPPRPVPNLGYACLNMALREQKPPVFTNRDCIQRTFKEKGLPYISSLAVENCKALAGVIQWNHEHNIRLFRMTSNFFPWCTEYQLKELPDFEVIKQHLAFAGALARAYDQRLTFHPSHFIKLAAPDEDLLKRSIQELEVHSQIFDLMGYDTPSVWNKINIHIGGMYNNKAETLKRFAAGVRRLSPACAARLTVENDDVASYYSVADLLPLSREARVPLVFDFHHHKFCPGGMTEKEAFYACLETWPEGIRPVVHWSESQEGRKLHAHSDYVVGPMDLHGMEDKVDVMIEAKCKERALLCYREGGVPPVAPLPLWTLPENSPGDAIAPKREPAAGEPAVEPGAADKQPSAVETAAEASE